MAGQPMPRRRTSASSTTLLGATPCPADGRAVSADEGSEMQQEDAAPKAEPRPVLVDAAGVKYEDPYSWLEEDSPETLRVAGGAERRRRTPPAGRRGLRRTQGESLEHAHRRDLRERAARLWRALAPHGARRGRRAARGRRRPAGPWRAVLAVEQLSEPGRPASLDWFFPRRTVATSPSASPGAATSSAFCACSTWSAKKCSLSTVPETWYSRVAWLPDSSGFFFPAGPYAWARQRDLLCLRPGDEAPDARVSRGLGIARRSAEPLAGYPQVSADGRWLTLASERFGGRIALARRLPDGAWFEVARGPGGGASLRLRGRRRLRGGRDRGRPARPPRALSARVGARPLHVDRAAAGVRRGPGERRPRRRSLRRGEPRGCGGAPARARPTGVVRRGGAAAGARRRGRAGVQRQLQDPPADGGRERRRRAGRRSPSPSLSPGSSPATYLYDIPVAAADAARAAGARPRWRVRRAPHGRRRATAGRCATRWSAARRHRSSPRPTLIFGYGGWDVAFVPAYLGKLAPSCSPAGSS